MPNEFRVFGPPGTGKTTYLSKYIRKVAHEIGSENVVVSSFTKAAATEIAMKEINGLKLPIPKSNVGTLHSHCYRSIGSPEIADLNIKQWNAEQPGFQMSNSKGSLDEIANEAQGKTEADELYNAYNILRAKMIDRSLWNPQVRAFAKRWEEFKKSNNLVDFTDMIEIAYKDVEKFPGNPIVGFFDETQDFVPLELALVRKWGKHMKQIVLGGDDDQCQPAGEMVLTPNGYRDIKDLDPEVDRVVCYSKCDKHLFGMRNGYKFKKSERYYFGKMFEVSANGKTSLATDNHLWLAKWSPLAKKHTYCVYLMEKAGKFRIGWCKLFRVDGTFHLGVRARLEGAEKAWILFTTTDKTEASIHESYFSAIHGITTAPFSGACNDVHYKQEHLDRLFNMLNDVDMEFRAMEMLHKLDLDYEYPIWTLKKAKAQRGGRSIMNIESVNLLPGLMQIPAMTGKGSKDVEWVDIDSIDCDIVDEATKVYSLEVEKYHTYVTNGLVTHNCIYFFKGASPEAFLQPSIPEKNIIPLEQSWRIPASVHAVAERWIRRIQNRRDKLYKPREDAVGSVKFADVMYRNPDSFLRDFEKVLGTKNEQGRPHRIMVLASCSYMLNELISTLRIEGLPFHNPYRRANGAWNPIKKSGRGTASWQKLARFLVNEEDVFGKNARGHTYEDVASFLTVLKAKGVCTGKKNKIVVDMAADSTLAKKTCPLEKYIDHEVAMLLIFGDLEEKLNWFMANLMGSKQDAFKYPYKVFRTKGMAGFTEQPQIIVGTIHSVKGGEADSVYLLPDLSPRGMQQWMDDSKGRDAIIRSYYVGMTRARERLVICSPSSGRHVDMTSFIRRGM